MGLARAHRARHEFRGAARARGRDRRRLLRDAQPPPRRGDRAAAECSRPYVGTRRLRVDPDLHAPTLKLPSRSRSRAARRTSRPGQKSSAGASWRPYLWCTATPSCSRQPLGGSCSCSHVSYFQRLCILSPCGVCLNIPRSRRSTRDALCTPARTRIWRTVPAPGVGIVRHQSRNSVGWALRPGVQAGGRCREVGLPCSNLNLVTNYQPSRAYHSIPGTLASGGHGGGERYSLPMRAQMFDRRCQTADRACEASYGTCCAPSLFGMKTYGAL